MIRNYLVFAVLLILLGSEGLAQSLTLSPYSRYGIGDLIPSTTVRNMSMGDIGVATMNYASVNRLNPASYADVLYTTLDVSGFTRYGQLKSATNSESQFSAGFKNLSFAFPTNNSLVLAFGFAPISAVGYDISTTYQVEIEDSLRTGISNYSAEGGLNQAFIGLAGKMLKQKLSVGVNGYYSFGSIKNDYSTSLEGASQATFSDVQIRRDAYMRGAGIQAGIIFTDSLTGRRKNVSKAKRKVPIFLRLGATADYGFDLNADRVTIFTNGFVVDSLGGVDTAKIAIPLKLSGGFAITKPGEWEISAEATYQDWSSFNYFDDGTQLNAALRIAAGGEFIPELGSTKYQKRVAYRAGVYMDKSYLTSAGESINDVGFTFGFGLPAGMKGTTVFNRERAYSRINLGFGIGKRGSLGSGQPLEELYYRINLGVTVNEKWFRKIRVD